MQKFVSVLGTPASVTQVQNMIEAHWWYAEGVYEAQFDSSTRTFASGLVVYQKFPVWHYGQVAR
jgi:hypothetical protein